MSGCDVAACRFTRWVNIFTHFTLGSPKEPTPCACRLLGSAKEVEASLIGSPIAATGPGLLTVFALNTTRSAVSLPMGVNQSSSSLPEVAGSYNIYIHWGGFRQIGQAVSCSRGAATLDSGCWSGLDSQVKLTGGWREDGVSRDLGLPFIRIPCRRPRGRFQRARHCPQLLRVRHRHITPGYFASCYNCCASCSGMPSPPTPWLDSQSLQVWTCCEAHTGIRPTLHSTPVWSWFALKLSETW